MIEPPAVLWEDPHGLAVAKPAGLLTQGPAGGEPTLEDWVRAHLRPDDPASAYVGNVHRLDRPVSGVILWAATPKAARRWSAQFAAREARKEYWAIVEVGPASFPLPDSGLWDDWIGRPDAAGRAPIASNPGPGLVRATTRFEAGPSNPDSAGLRWLRLVPESGRTHQLRAQSASRGLAIVGDRTYGASTAFGVGIALHSRSLSVLHPASGARVEIEAPLPTTWSGWGSPPSGFSRSRSR